MHLYGEACDLAALKALCDEHGLDLIEDCAQACGTLYRGEPVGRWGRFAAFSFYPTKNPAAFGDGGALVVNRPGDAEAARRSRFYGWDGRRQAVQFGVNSSSTNCKPGFCSASSTTSAARSPTAARWPAGIGNASSTWPATVWCCLPMAPTGSTATTSM